MITLKKRVRSEQGMVFRLFSRDWCPLRAGLGAGHGTAELRP